MKETHDQSHTKEQKIHFINALATVILAFTALIGLILALSEFIEGRFRIFGFGGTAWLVTIIIICFIITIGLTKRWIEK